MRPNPSLIPRFNLDYNTIDFITSIKSIFTEEFDMYPIESTFGPKEIFFTNYARTALYVTLKSLNLPPKSKIGVPLYCCTVVFDAIINSGYVPKFIEINSSYTMDPDDLKDKIEDLSAVIVIHTFGRPADMEKIKSVAKHIPIIEDCSHSLLSEYKGKITGTIGDASIFSLGKYLSAGGGGLLVVNNIYYLENIKKEINYLKQPSMTDEFKNTCLAYIKALFYQKPFFGLFGLPVGLMLENKIDLMGNKSLHMAKGNKSHISITLKKLTNFRKKVELQRKNSFFLIEKLKNTSLILPYEEKNTYYNYYLFPLLIKNRDETSEYLRNKGIDTTKLFSQTPEIAKHNYGYNSDCPFTEKVARSIITVPNHYTLQKKELKKIAEIIKSCPHINDEDRVRNS
jgi:dTDP-4-amino-4,6-dideoxygalactose transaminase